MMAIDQITGRIVENAIKIHRDLGPGLLESVYEPLMARILTREGLSVIQQVPVGIDYDGIRFERAFSIDILVEGRVVIEIKSTEKLSAVHFKQVSTYLRLGRYPVGLLINFGAATLKEGLKRIVNGYKPEIGSPLTINQTGPDAVVADDDDTLPPPESLADLAASSKLDQ